MSQCSSCTDAKLLLGIATETNCSDEDLAIAIDRFMAEGGHNFSALTSLACARDSVIQPALTAVAKNMSLEFETCSARWQEAMDKYIQKFHAGVEGLQWQASTVALFNAGRKKLVADPRQLEVNGHSIALALGCIKDQPLAEYRSHLVFCSIEPCIPENESKAFAHRLRGLARDLGMNSGERRMKITRSLCCGACRKGSVSVVYENLQPGETPVNNGSWIAHGDELSDHQWQEVFKAIDERRPLTDILDARHFVPKQVR